MKRAFTIIMVLFISTKVYYVFANDKRIEPEVEPIELAAFDIPDIKDEGQLNDKKDTIKAVEGDGAFDINPETKIAANAYGSEVLNVTMISTFLNFEFEEQISVDRYPISYKVGSVHEPR